MLSLVVLISGTGSNLRALLEAAEDAEYPARVIAVGADRDAEGLAHAEEFGILGIGVVGGILLGLLAWISAGAAGPGRLVDVGPSPWLVGGVAAIEFGVAATVALFAGRPNRSTV